MCCKRFIKAYLAVFFFVCLYIQLVCCAMHAYLLFINWKKKDGLRTKTTPVLRVFCCLLRARAATIFWNDSTRTASNKQKHYYNRDMVHLFKHFGFWDSLVLGFPLPSYYFGRKTKSGLYVTCIKHETPYYCVIYYVPTRTSFARM